MTIIGIILILTLATAIIFQIRKENKVDSNLFKTYERDRIDLRKKSKIIHYKDELISFPIPAHWVEEYDQIGSGIFYEPVPAYGILNFDVTTFVSRPDKILGMLEDILRKDGLDAKKYLTQEGDTIVEYREHSKNDDVMEYVYYFICVRKTKQANYINVRFTWTIDTVKENEKEDIADLAMIRNMVKSLHFG